MALDQAGLVHVGWRQGDNDGASKVDDVMYARQLTGSTFAFSAPLRVSCPDNTAACPGVDSSLVAKKNDDPVVDVDVSGNAYVVWDSNETGKLGDMFFARSLP